jgi:DNA polymerase I-like protein with 3'-5' exonuclease and polymerase domains
MKLKAHYLRKLQAEGLEDFFYKHEVMPLYKHVTIPMEQHGIALDLPLMQETLSQITSDIASIESQILADIQPLLAAKFTPWFLGKDYAPSRSGNFAQGFCEYYQLPLPKTATGRYSLSEAAIAALPDGHAKAVLLKQEMMTAEEIASVQSLLARKEHGDGPLFNLQSKHHLKKLFFDTLGLEPLSTTDLGNPQVDDEFIHSISGQYGWANDLHVYNRLQKLKATYIERVLEKQTNGIFYPSFFQHRTISGRFGSDLQQQKPKNSLRLCASTTTGFGTFLLPGLRVNW